MILYVLCFIVCFYLIFKFICLFPFKIPRFRFDPSALEVYYGAPGSGKSTLACWYARKAIACGIPVYSNLPIIGCRQFDKSDIGSWLMEDCLVIWDEISVDAHARNFKNNFTPQQIQWLKYHRHEHAMVMIFSQGFDDMDKVLRTLTTAAFVVRKGLFHTITYKRIQKRPDIDEITHKPDDIYSFVPFSTKRIYARPIWKYFDSYMRLGLPARTWHIFGDETGANESE